VLALVDGLRVRVITGDGGRSRDGGPKRRPPREEPNLVPSLELTDIVYTSGPLRGRGTRDRKGARLDRLRITPSRRAAAPIRRVGGAGARSRPQGVGGAPRDAVDGVSVVAPTFDRVWMVPAKGLPGERTEQAFHRLERLDYPEAEGSGAQTPARKRETDA
jgi:hypothetical protein